MTNEKQMVANKNCRTRNLLIKKVLLTLTLFNILVYVLEFALISFGVEV